MTRVYSGNSTQEGKVESAEGARQRYASSLLLFAQMLNRNSTEYGWCTRLAQQRFLCNERKRDWLTAVAYRDGKPYPQFSCNSDGSR